MTDTPRRKIKIFVSSTYQDLMEHRRACQDVLAKLSNDHPVEFVGMENFAADDFSPRDLSLKKVEDSDMYVGIFGMRYGSIVPEDGVSITELEYRLAKNRKLPCLIFIIDEKNALVTPDSVETGIGADRLRDLKKDLRDLTQGHTVVGFRSAEDLAKQLAISLVRELGKVSSDSTLKGLRDRIDRAILDACRFIKDMKDFTNGRLVLFPGWPTYKLGYREFPACLGGWR